MSGSIQQSGTVIPGHAAVWYGNGAVIDGGAPGAGVLSGVGVTNNGSLALGINSGLITGPFIQYGVTVNSSGTAVVSLNSFNGAPSATLQYQINGTNYTFNPVGNGNITGPGSAVSGDVVSFNGNSGVLVQDSGISVARVVQGPTVAVSGDLLSFNGTTGNSVVDAGVSASALITVVASIAALKALTSSSFALTRCFVLGYSTAGDGGEGAFAVGTTTTANNVTIFNDASGRSWYRLSGDVSVNVRWAGAVGNGSTDDTAAIQAAESAASAAGVSLFFPSGVYMINNNSIIKASGVSWFGAGKSSSILRGMAQTFTNSLVSGGTCSNMTFRDLGFDGINMAGSGFFGLLAIATFTNGIIVDCGFTNIVWMGVVISGGAYYTIKGCTFTRTAATSAMVQGIWIRQLTATTSNVIIDGNFAQYIGHDFSMTNSVISNNVVIGWGYGAGITTEQASTCSNLTITGNVCSGGVGTDANGVNPPGIENWAPYSTISGNVCFDNSGPGITQGGAFCTVCGNVVYNNGTGGSHPGITSRYVNASYNASGSIIVGNKVFDTRGSSATQIYGYTDDGSNVTDVTLADNSFVGNSVAPMSATGVRYNVRLPQLFGYFFISGATVPAGGEAGGGTLTVTGAALGDTVRAAYSINLSGLQLLAWVSAANSVSFTFQNPTGGSITIGASNIALWVEKPLNYASY